eukprot:3131861-Pyramimonas_sp.AAC.1
MKRELGGRAYANIVGDPWVYTGSHPPPRPLPPPRPPPPPPPPPHPPFLLLITPPCRTPRPVFRAGWAFRLRRPHQVRL